MRINFKKEIRRMQKERESKKYFWKVILSGSLFYLGIVTILALTFSI